MATLYENNHTQEDYESTFGVRWRGQTFTPSTAHTITSVFLKLYKIGTPGADFNVSIRNTTANLPSGADLCNGTLSTAGITTDTGGANYEITLGAGASLDAAKKYAIIFSNPGGTDAANCIRERDTELGSSYAGGDEVTSTDSGVSWTEQATFDYWFEEWGNAGGGGAVAKPQDFTPLLGVT